MLLTRRHNSPHSLDIRMWAHLIWSATQCGWKSHSLAQQFFSVFSQATNTRCFLWRNKTAFLMAHPGRNGAFYIRRTLKEWFEECSIWGRKIRFKMNFEKFTMCSLPWIQSCTVTDKRWLWIPLLQLNFGKYEGRLKGFTRHAGLIRLQELQWWRKRIVFCSGVCVPCHPIVFRYTSFWPSIFGSFLFILPLGSLQSVDSHNHLPDHIPFDCLLRSI